MSVPADPVSWPAAKSLFFASGHPTHCACGCSPGGGSLVGDWIAGLSRALSAGFRRVVLGRHDRRDAAGGIPCPDWVVELLAEPDPTDAGHPRVSAEMAGLVDPVEQGENDARLQRLVALRQLSDAVSAAARRDDAIARLDAACAMTPRVAAGRAGVS